MKLLNYGSCNIDYVYKLDHIVSSGETESTDGLSVFSGGKGLNQSIAISRAGAKVYHAGAIGVDGDFLLDLLLDSGVDVSNVKRVQSKNGHAIIQVASSGENSIFLYPGSNAMIEKEDIDNVLSYFSKGDVILLQNEISNLDYIIDSALKKEMIIILNPSPINETIYSLDLSKISYLILNEIEAKLISNSSDYLSALEYFKSNYPKLKVVLTLGKFGSVYQDNKLTVSQSSYNVNAVDTTAAGDTFTGYFVSEILKGNKVKTALNIASLASAIAVSREGAAPSIPKYSEVVNNLNILKQNEEKLGFDGLRCKIDRIIDENLKTVNVKTIAKSIGYSEVYTGVLIKKITGVSYKEYLLERRLVKAEDLIKNTSLPISEIIFTVGYENENYFRKKFTKKYGKKPLEYRRSFK